MNESLTDGKQSMAAPGKHECYELLVQSRDKFSDRRATISSVFLTLNTAILAVIAYIVKDLPIDPLKYNQFVPVFAFVPLCGYLLCLMWLVVVDYYLAEQKFLEEQIQKYEEDVLDGYGFKPFTQVKKFLGEKRNHPSAQLAYYGVPLIFWNIYWLLTCFLLAPPGHNWASIAVIFLSTLIFNAVALGVFSLDVQQVRWWQSSLEKWSTKEYLITTLLYLAFVFGLSTFWALGFMTQGEHYVKDVLLKDYQPKSLMPAAFKAAIDKLAVENLRAEDALKSVSRELAAEKDSRRQLEVQLETKTKELKDAITQRDESVKTCEILQKSLDDLNKIGQPKTPSDALIENKPSQEQNAAGSQ